MTRKWLSAEPISKSASNAATQPFGGRMEGCVESRSVGMRNSSRLCTWTMLSGRGATVREASVRSSAIERKRGSLIVSPASRTLSWSSCEVMWTSKTWPPNVQAAPPTRTWHCVVSAGPHLHRRTAYLITLPRSSVTGGQTWHVS